MRRVLARNPDTSRRRHCERASEDLFEVLARNSAGLKDGRGPARGVDDGRLDADLAGAADQYEVDSVTEFRPGVARGGGLTELKRLADGALMSPPKADSSAKATGRVGTRTAPVSSPPVVLARNTLNNSLHLYSGKMTNGVYSLERTDGESDVYGASGWGDDTRPLRATSGNAQGTVVNKTTKRFHPGQYPPLIRPIVGQRTALQLPLKSVSLPVAQPRPAW